MIGYAFCGSFCTLSHSLAALRRLCAEGETVQPILSEKVMTTDTRFWQAQDFKDTVTALCEREPVSSIVGAEPLGPTTPLEVLVIAPCTGNTLAKIAQGITDSAVTMAAKAHLRSDRPLLLAVASNDALSANLKNIATLLARKQVYFVPMRQDDPNKKPHSLVADFTCLPEALACTRRGHQIHPLFL